jgi:hypothetical protein
MDDREIGLRVAERARDCSVYGLSLLPFQPSV